MSDMSTAREGPAAMAEETRVCQRIDAQNLYGPDPGLFQTKPAIARQIEQEMPGAGR